MFNILIENANSKSYSEGLAAEKNQFQYKNDN